MFCEPVLIAKRPGGVAYYVYHRPGVGWNMHPAFKPPRDMASWGGYKRVDSMLALRGFTLDDLRLN